MDSCTGDINMAYLVTQSLSSINDPDLEAVSSSEVSVTKNILVLSHQDIELNIKPTFTLNGKVINLGEIGSGSPYEIKRISKTQTIILCTGIIPSDLPIGDAVIGESFVIQ